MSWECGCGVVNGDSRPTCSSCGTVKGMVWTPEGFKPPGEAASVIGTRKGGQGYAWGWVMVIATTANFLQALSKAPDDARSLGAALTLALFIAAMALRQPWGWYVLLAMIGLSLLVFVGLSAAALLGQEPGVIIVASVVAIPLNLAWFVYLYKRRAMFGAKGRWKWFERTFPSFVGPEEKVSIPMAEPAGRGRASQMGPSQEAVQPVAMTASPTKALEYPNHNTRIQLWKKCPRCAEKCYLEDTRCQHCDYQFDAEELAHLIARIFDEHKDQFSRYVDFNSETKQCPACAETLKLEALICRYCRRDFTSAEVQISKMRAFRQKAMGITHQ